MSQWEVERHMELPHDRAGELDAAIAKLASDGLIETILIPRGALGPRMFKLAP